MKGRERGGLVRRSGKGDGVDDWFWRGIVSVVYTGNQEGVKRGQWGGVFWGSIIVIFGGEGGKGGGR